MNVKSVKENRKITDFVLKILQKRIIPVTNREGVDTEVFDLPSIIPIYVCTKTAKEQKQKDTWMMTLRSKE